ncbi:MAG TPA: T9SS type A sorting domain-containing protein [Flavobacteriaceae bacterium]|nr:T9SS type A sorting domain-containing protein [Flavobacteriaceae bacterium]
MKKLLLIFFLLFFTYSFAQQSDRQSNATVKNNPLVTLSQVTAYPNPFVIKTGVHFKSTQSQRITFTVKNLLGKIVYSENIFAKKGSNKIIFDRNSLQKGMYIYSIQTDSEAISKRLVIK